MIDVSIVIVTWKIKELIDNCIRSIKENTNISYEIIVVDNNSADGTVELIRGKFPEVKVIELDKNLGFSKANNFGIRIAKGENILLLNPDTIIMPNAIDNMLEVLNKRERVGVIGPKILNEDGSIQLTCARSFPTLLTEFLNFAELTWLFHRGRFAGAECMRYWDHDSEKDVDLISGSCMMLRKKVIDEVGGMDEDFFMYGEDIMLCWKIRQCGWIVHFTPSATIVHFSGQSSKKVINKMNVEHLEAQLRLYCKIKGKYYGIIFRYIVCLLSALWIIVESFRYIICRNVDKRSVIKNKILPKYSSRLKWCLFKKDTRRRIL